MKTNKEYNKLEQEIVRLLNERDSALQALRWCLRQIAEYLGTWYGHTTEQKYERISGYAAAGASPVQPSQAQAALDAILWYYENCTGSEPSISAFQQMVDRVVKMKPNFCESCAMDIATCDCVTPRPATVTVQPSQADAQDAARVQALEEARCLILAELFDSTLRRNLIDKIHALIGKETK